MIRGGALVEPSDEEWLLWVRREPKIKFAILSLFMKNILSSRCHESFVPFKRKTSFMQNNYHTALETPSALGLYHPTKLASTSYSVSLCCFYNLFQRWTSPIRKVGSTCTSTSSLGFPGGSLGRRNKLAWVMFI